MKRFLFTLCPLSVVAQIFAASALGANLSHGPVLGSVSATDAALWMRADGPGRFHVRLEDTKGEGISRIGPVGPETDFSATFRFSGLNPDRAYFYKIELDGAEVYRGSFSTFPNSFTGAFRFAFGACFKPEFDVKEGAGIFEQIRARNPHAVIFTGDMPYSTNGALSEIREGHKVIREARGFVSLCGFTPVFAVWDDHDFGPNNADSRHPYAAEAFRGFQEAWPNPSFGLPDAPGVFYSFRAGDAEFFMLDDRMFRIQEKGEAGALLGDAQTGWLLQGLRQSSARIKFIVSGVQFALKKDDSWGGKEHRDERDQLFSFIRDENIRGVVLLSGDRHRVDVMRIDIGGDRRLYEFSSSPLGAWPRGGDTDLTREAELVFTHGEDWNQFCEIDVQPVSNSGTALVFRAFSGTKGQVGEVVVRPEDL